LRHGRELAGGALKTSLFGEKFCCLAESAATEPEFRLQRVSVLKLFGNCRTDKKITKFGDFKNSRYREALKRYSGNRRLENQGQEKEEVKKYSFEAKKSYIRLKKVVSLRRKIYINGSNYVQLAKLVF
jgi:hypothetical protein